MQNAGPDGVASAEHSDGKAGPAFLHQARFKIRSHMSLSDRTTRSKRRPPHPCQHAGDAVSEVLYRAGVVGDDRDYGLLTVLPS